MNIDEEDKFLKMVGLELMFLTPEKYSNEAGITAVELAKREENAGKTIVALLPDSGDRYYSTPLFLD